MDTRHSATTGRSKYTWGAIVAAVLAVDCSPDIFDVSVDLTPEVFSADFGAANGTIPVVTCDAQAPAICGGDKVIEFADAAGQATVRPGCDAGTARCFAQADARGTDRKSVV